MGDTQGILLAIMAVCSGGTVLATQASPDERPMPASMAAVAVAENAAAPLIIERSSDGLFYIEGRVAGHRVRFLVDTGANLTLLAPADAERAGLVANGSLPLETANGSAQIAASLIKRLDLAGRELGSLKVGIAPNGLPVSLLGQDALSQLGAVTFSANSMTIHGASAGALHDASKLPPGR